MLRPYAAARVIRDFWTSSARSGERLWTAAPEVIAARGPLARVWRWLDRPVDALPLDLFRILIGLLTLSYFVRTLAESTLYSNPSGLIDHDLSIAVFPFTRMGLFQLGMPPAVFRSVFILACLASLTLIVGYRARLSAAVLYAIAVSTYRWNFLVMFIDDGIMHLMLFWLLLLPIARTLVLTEWSSHRMQAWKRWKSMTVPGTAVRCFLWNAMLIYAVAGLWKWTSPMWRNGTALYAVLQLPIARASHFWGPQYMPILKTLNYAALLLETIFPVIFLLPKGSRAKYALLIALIGFHCCMIATLQIPVANVACIAATVVLFGPELMSWIRRQQVAALPGWPTYPDNRAIWQPRSAAAGNLVTTQTGNSATGSVAIVFIILLTLAMLSSVALPEWRTPVRLKTAAASSEEAFEGLRPLQKVFFTPLWIAGLCQQYQLFNWIDERNYVVRYDVFDGTRRIDPASVFPRTTRGALLQAYVHGISWMQIPAWARKQLRQSIYLRSARRYCHESEGPADVTVYSTLRRGDAVHPDRAIEQSRSFLVQFRCRAGEPLMQAMNLSP